MTVKELKEVLNNFDDDLLVKFPYPLYVDCTDVFQGINGMDGCVMLVHDCKEDE
nr:MAG TPA: hypothetical protein [Bacteriophage sp.]